MIDVALEGEIQFDTNGQFVSAHCILHDITERALAEQAIRESQERFGTVFRSSPIGIFITTADGTLIDSNQAFLDMFGYTRAQVIGHSSQELKLWHDPGEQNKLVKLLGSQGAVSNRELKYRRKDGELGEALAFVELIELAGKQCLLIMLYDVTDRKQAEGLLKKSEAELKKAQQISHVGNWVWHISTNRLEWSDEMYRIFGIDKEGFSGDLTDVMQKAIHPDDRPAVEQSNLSVIKDKKPVPLEYRVVQPDGTVRTVWAEAGELILDPAGNPAILTGIVQDITEQAQMVEKLQESQTRYHELFENIDIGVAVYKVIGKGEDFIFTDFNRAGESIDQQQRESLVGKSIFEVRPNAEQFGLIEALRQVWQTGEPVHLPSSWYQDDKLAAWYENFIYKLPSGEIVTVFNDVTERKQAEENQRRRAEELAALQETVLDITSHTIYLICSSPSLNERRICSTQIAVGCICAIRNGRSCGLK